MGRNARPPPSHIYFAVERGAPGIWRAFDRSAGRTFGPETVVTSWWRSQALNHQIAGARYSQHLVGLALDLWEPGRIAPGLPDPLAALERRARAAGWGYVANEVDHIHVQAYRASEALARFVDRVSRA